MPTYQYRCQACHNDLEAFQKFTDDPLTICPDCGGSLRKVFNPVGIVFKGSGFYATDSRKSSSVAKPASTDHSTSTSTSSDSSDSSAKSSSTTKASSEKTTAAA
ncbi:MAG: zinc ribbon domain-containing protein [Propionibacterium sp.]|nr:zinc ribbon domain-containing protein [Propionibacterium sp.]